MIDVSEDEAGSGGPASRPRHEDNSIGRLLALSDGIFAIAITLLALDLRVPDGLGKDVGDRQLLDALGASASTYWTFLLTFWVLFGYWSRHRRLLRSVQAFHEDLARDSMFLLLFVAAMPFPTSLLGHYGSHPISIALYGAVNAAATLSLIVMDRDVRRLALHDPADVERRLNVRMSWYTVAVFVLLIPAGFLFHSYGLWVLVLLALPERGTPTIRLIRGVYRRLPRRQRA